MPEHEVSPVDFDTRAALTPRSARALVGVVAAIAVVAGILVGCSLLGESNEPQTAFGSAGLVVPSGRHQSTAPSSVSPTAEAPETTPTTVVVSVQGSVHRPGLFRLPGATRVGEAIDHAGGALPEAQLSGVNLAEAVVDGMQVTVNREGSLVTYPGQVAPGSSAASQGMKPAETTPAGGGASNAKVNLNQADATTLQTLDGVGPATAQAIVAWREVNGKFSSIEQLMEVRGIGPAKFEAMKARVTV